MSRRSRLAELKAAAPVVLPSLLLCDFGDLRGEVRRLEEAGARGLHLDVMDGHFVPNMTYGLTVVETVRRLTRLPLDVHLMIANPQSFLRHYYEAGADIITIHAEAAPRAIDLLDEIRDLGAAAGLAINPATSVDVLVDALPHCDLALVMSVPAGFGGQPFDDRALDKLRTLRPLVGPGTAHPETVLEIDGGIGASTIARSAAAGAELFVVGSAIFRHPPYTRSIAELTQLARSA